MVEGYLNRVTAQDGFASVYWVGGRTWRLSRGIVFYDLSKGIAWPIPQGFQFDLASIPRLFWRLVAPQELSPEASLVHDYLYRNGGQIGPWDHPYSRKGADDLFREIMKGRGVPFWRRIPAYWAVRLFGGLWAWDNRRIED